MEDSDRTGFRHFIVDIVDRIKQKLPPRPKRIDSDTDTADPRDIPPLPEGSSDTSSADIDDGGI